MTDYISRRSVMELVQFMPAKGGPIGIVPTKAEELVDVLNAYTAVFGDFEAVEKAVEQSKRSPKWGRWVDRLE